MKEIPPDIYEQSLAEVPVLSPFEPEPPAERLFEDDDVADAVEKNHDFLWAFHDEVVVPRREYLAEHLEAPIGEHFRNRGIYLLERVEADREAELVVSPGFGFGIRLPEGETERTLFALMNSTFLFDDDWQTKRPDSELTHVVFDGRTIWPRDYFEWGWCIRTAPAYEENETLAGEAEEVVKIRLGETPLIKVMPDGTLEAMA